MNGGASLPTVSVVIPTRGRPKPLQRCLTALLADRATTETVVVVDGQDPETEELLDRLAQRDPRVRRTSNPPEPAELGRVQRARDHGVKLAGSEVVLAMDDDVVAHPGLVSGHARVHADEDDLVVVGYMPVVTPRRWPHTFSTISYYADAYETFCEEIAADPDSILRQLWGGNVSVRRSHWLEAIEQPRVASSLDDKEIGLLFLRAGLRGVFERDLRADHWYERSLRRTVSWAEQSCVAQADLRAAHPELLGEFNPGPPPGPHMRVLRRLTQSSVGWFAIKWALIALTAAAAALRLSTVEDKGTVAMSWLAWERTAARLPDASG